MGLQKFVWYFVQCDRCGFTPHSWGRPTEGGYLAAFESEDQALEWLEKHWLKVGEDWYCPRCAEDTRGGLT